MAFKVVPFFAKQLGNHSVYGLGCGSLWAGGTVLIPLETNNFWPCPTLVPVMLNFIYDPQNQQKEKNYRVKLKLNN